MTFKQDLLSQLESVVPEYGLVKLIYPSFMRCFGYKSQPLSCDAVEGISALLDVAGGHSSSSPLGTADPNVKPPATVVPATGPKAVKRAATVPNLLPSTGIFGVSYRSIYSRSLSLEIEVEETRNDEEWFGMGRVWEIPGLVNGGYGEHSAWRTEEDGEQKEVDRWDRNSWMAYDALSDTHILQQSLSLFTSPSLAKVPLIIDKQEIRTMRDHCFERRTRPPPFSHPGVLPRLALWLVLRDMLPGTNASTRSKRKSLPLKPKPLLPAFSRSILPEPLISKALAAGITCLRKIEGQES
ncbi:DNA replication initiation factor cdc45 [Stygiomarasmius scandens]|uniref:DNA replication initiation factor cdc45 n=1 Tax=Marasmiellus scandens TaxID=2682957 RepID=A0ABR1IXQ8_9AGAR